MNSTYSKVKTIAEDTGLRESKVAEVLYDYLTWCLQELLIDGNCHTVFGNLTLDKEQRLHLDTPKEGLIELLSKTDVKLIRKIVEDGPDTSIFGI